MGLQSAEGMLATEAGKIPAALQGVAAHDHAIPPAVEPWVPSRWAAISRPLPDVNFIDGLIQRVLTFMAVKQVRAIYGLENMLRAPQPFMIAANHSIKREALLFPALLCFNRRGRWIRFVGDWNFLLIPLIGWVMRRSGIIVVTRKPAKPAILNRLKPRYEQATTVAERIKATLASGECVGIFPEGTVNRDPSRLLVGRVGMSRLSLETGVPIIPVGIRFPGADPDRPLSEKAPMEIHIGQQIVPPPLGAGRTPSIAQSRAWHRTVMTEIARLSGKSWGLQTQVDDDGP